MVKMLRQIALTADPTFGSSSKRSGAEPNIEARSRSIPKRQVESRIDFLFGAGDLSYASRLTDITVAFGGVL